MTVGRVLRRASVTAPAIPFQAQRATNTGISVALQMVLMLEKIEYRLK